MGVGPKACEISCRAAHPGAPGLLTVGGMSHASTRWASSGQATLEHLGVTLAIALLMATLGTWVAGEVRPPDRAPALIEHITEPLMAQMPPAIPADARFRLRQEAERTAGEKGIFRRAFDAVLSWGTLNADGEIEMARGFLDQLGVRAEDLVKHPVETLTAAVQSLTRDPVKETAGRVSDIAGYLSDLGKKPFRVTFLNVSRDLGGMAADWLIARAARYVGGRVSAAVTSSTGRRPKPTPPDAGTRTNPDPPAQGTTRGGVEP